MFGGNRFEKWLNAYGAAWEARDGKAFAKLFHERAVYYWTPFEEPKLGNAAITTAFENAISNQETVTFTGRVIKATRKSGTAHWRCAYTRTNTGRQVFTDGILEAEFKNSGKAIMFREWWHIDEQ